MSASQETLRLEVTHQPVDGWRQPELCVRGRLEGSPARNWQVIERVERYAEVFPAVHRVELLSRQGEQVHSRLWLKLPFPLPSICEDVRALHRPLGPDHFLRSWITESRAYRRNVGSWELQPWPGAPEHTLACYRVHLVLALPVPAALAQRLQQSATAQLFEALRAATPSYAR